MAFPGTFFEPGSTVLVNHKYLAWTPSPLVGKSGFRLVKSCPLALLVRYGRLSSLFTVSGDKSLFFLSPRNPAACSVIQDSENIHLQDVNTTDSPVRLGLGWHVANRCRTTIATFGRAGCDILLRGSEYSKLHFSFEYSEVHDAVLLCDHSRYQTVYVKHFGMASPAGSVARQVVLIPGTELEFTVGNGASILDFVIFWGEQPSYLHLVPPMRVGKACDARTQRPTGKEELNTIPTILDHPPEPLVWFKRGNPIGKGGFGLVFLATHAHTCKRLAVKEFVRQESELDSKMNERGIVLLTTLKHVSKSNRQLSASSTD
jgi:hypothetical protein